MRQDRRCPHQRGAAGGEHWIDIGFGRNIVRTAKEIEEIADRTWRSCDRRPKRCRHAGYATRVLRQRGALEEAAKELGEPLNPDEVKQ